MNKTTRAAGCGNDPTRLTVRQEVVVRSLFLSALDVIVLLAEMIGWLVG